MPNFNARILTHVDNDGRTNIKIRVTHQGKTRYISTEYYIKPEYFDNATGRVKSKYPLSGDINIELAALELTYSRKMVKLEGRIKDISIADLLLFLQGTDGMGALDFYSVAQKRVEFLKQLKKASSAGILEQTINQVKGYTGISKLPFVSINDSWLRGFESWYKEKGSQNAAAIHLRNIRTLFNLAMDEYHLSPEYYPFRKFKIKTQETVHRDLPAEEIKRFLAFQPEENFKKVAQDLWMLSFFLVGINFKDLLLIPKTAVTKGRLVYNRAKTGIVFSVKIEPEAQAIIDRYQGQTYLLKFIEDKKRVQDKKDRKTPLYKDLTDRTNKELKKIAKTMNTNKEGKFVHNIEPELSTYYARHSWGTIASRLNVSHDIIREALGHNRTVTDTYINFYTKKIDEANRQIIDAVMGYGQPAE